MQETLATMITSLRESRELVAARRSLNRMPMDFLSTLGPWMYPLATVAVILLMDIIRAGLAIASIEKEMPAAGPPRSCHAST